MGLPSDQFEELRKVCPAVSLASEAGVDYVFIPGLALPPDCSPGEIDALLCPTPRDGYPSRLFFGQLITGPGRPNWNKQNERILDRNWFAFSFKVPSGLRLAQMLASHLKGLL